MKTRKTRARLMAFLTALALAFSAWGASLAEGQTAAISGKGSITAPKTIYLRAPMGGQIGDFSWTAGDAARTGDIAFVLQPATLTAANDGLIVGMRARVGDQADAVAAQYGALCYIDRQGLWNIDVSTASAYNQPENRDVNLGDVLRVRKGSGESEKTGAGTVVSVRAGAFVLEMAAGDFELEDDVNIYLGKGTAYKSAELVGKGKIARPALIPMLGTGVVAKILVKNGDAVKRGEPLFYMDAANAQYDRQAGNPEVAFPQDCLISQVLATPGQTVFQGQALMVLIPADQLEATIEIDELDIAKVTVGQEVQLIVDAYPDRTFSGMVTEIIPIGKIELDATKYDVRVSLSDQSGLMLGMHVTGYLGQ